MLRVEIYKYPCGSIESYLDTKYKGYNPFKVTVALLYYLVNNFTLRDDFNHGKVRLTLGGQGG